MCTSKKQQWDVLVSKKREKIHQPCEISLVMFSRPHPENGYPFLGASPDSLVDCSCCGFGLLKCKCLSSARDKNISEYLTTPGCVILEKDHSYELKPNHPYYTQVQHQMFVTGTSYCDFEVYLPKESCTFRIKIDPDYLQHCVRKLVTFFNSIILPYLYNIDDIEISTTCKNVINNLLKKVEENVNRQIVINELQQLSTFNQYSCSSCYLYLQKKTNFIFQNIINCYLV